MINQKVLVSDAKHFALDAHINPYYGAGVLDKAKASLEHAEVVAAFERAGIEVVRVPSPEGSQDGIYTANWALVRGKKAVLARLPEVRKAEEDYAEQLLTDLGYDVVRVPEDWLFSGQGDALVCGNLLFAGSGYRSDVRAQQFAAETLGLKLVQLHAVPSLRQPNGFLSGSSAKADPKGQANLLFPLINEITGLPDSFFYDLDLAVAVIDEKTIAVCMEALDEASRQKVLEAPVEKIFVSIDEARNGFALNMVSTGETVVMSAHAPEFAEKLRERGLELELLDITELVKGGGFIRCVSLTLQ
jgi:N-dimethylarginine dimethylaminohydrolase